MRVVMTLLVRDEIDVVRENLDFHFAQGIDFAIVMDNRSRDGTREALREYERTGRLRIIDQPGLYDQAPWLTEMAQMAVREEAADWVLPNDADEFWVPREGTVRQLLERTAPEVGAIRCPRVYFAPATEDGRPWWERMTLRQRVPVSKTGLALNSKLIHRGHEQIEIGKGNHQRQGPLVGETLSAGDVEVQHFQMRTYAQFERGVIVRGSTLKGATGHRQQFNLSRRREYRIWRRGELPDYYRRYLREEPDDEYAGDGRVRDTLRSLYESAGSSRMPGREGQATFTLARARLGAVPTRLRSRAARALRRRPAPPAPFIVGVPYSGTTLLRQMLDSHSQLTVSADTHLLPDLIRRWRRDEAAGAGESELVQAAITLVTSHHGSPGLGVDAERLAAHLGAIRRPSLVDVARAVHLVRAEAEGKPRWGDETPPYLGQMRLLNSVIGEARFLHVIRDGRDVALSLADAGDGLSDSEAAIRMWRKQVRGARRQAAKLPPHHYAEVRYEALAREPEVVLRRVARFLDLPFDVAMLNRRQRRQALPAGSTLGDRIERWRMLTPGELRRLENAAGDVLGELRYEVDG